MKKLLWIFVMFVSVNIFAQTKPVLSNFRIEKSNKDRVYFDSSGDISGLTKQGFVISGKTISSISTSGKYFTVSSPFTFWDNNTVRLENGNGAVYDFTLTYIENNISEPEATKNKYYVSVTGDDKNKGTSEKDAWRTISKAANTAKEGSTVWIKAGNYGNEHVVMKNSGRIDNPIKFIGYKNSIGDINSMYFSYAKGLQMDSSEMPTLKGIPTDWGFKIDKNYVIVRNIQVGNYQYNFISNTTIGLTGVVIDNCLSHTTGLNQGFIFYNTTSTKNRIINCTALNAGMTNISNSGTFTLIKNCKAYTDKLDLNGGTDYAIYTNNSNNIITDCYIERESGVEHTGHGYTVKANGLNTEYNLIQNSTSLRVGGAVELRHSQVKHNVVKNMNLIGPQTNGLTVRDRTSLNTMENITITNGTYGIRFYDSVEDGGRLGSGFDNTFKNCILNNCSQNVYIGYPSSKESPTGNKFYNLTIYGGTSLFTSTLPFPSSNEFINCTISNITKYYDSNGQSGGAVEPTFTNCNFYNNKFNDGGAVNPPIGTNIIEVDPKFKDLINFVPQNDKLKFGTLIKGVKYDKSGNERDDPPTIGAVEILDNTTGSINANAGSDQSICLGESVTLTATGGSTYSWNTGATTKSITVNPNTTTTYTVTVSEGSDSDSDNVQVIVNNVTANAGGNQTITAGDSVTLTANGGDSYVWNTGDTTASITVSPTSTTTYTVTAKKGDCEDTDTVQVTVNTAATVTANAGSDQSICLGESVTLTASGGSSYSWNTGATTKSITVNPNTTTTYTVTVSEGSASDSDNVQVIVNSVSANAGGNQNIVAGDSVTLTANGGDSYVWNTGAATASITVSPTATTTYTVTAKKGDCEDTDTVTVTVNTTSTVTANAGVDQNICLGESVTLIASGGSSYSWNTGATTKSITVHPNNTTTYTVTVTEGSTSDSDSVEVTVNNVTANAGANKTIYEGESITLTASGGDSYLWSTGARSKSITVSPQETQNYTLTAYINGCEDTATVQVTVNKKDTSPPPAKANAGEDQTICLGESVTLTATGGKTYSWSTGETTKSIQVNPTRTTSYTVTATRGGVTNSDAVVVTVENCSAISETSKQEEMSVYPNPTTGILNIKADNDYSSLHLNIYSMNGSIVYSDVVETRNNVAYKTVDISNLSKGVYVVRMFNSDYHKIKRVLLR